MNAQAKDERGVDLGAVRALMKKEFLDNVRSKWILVITGLFLALTLVVSYFAGVLNGGPAGFQPLSVTVSSMLKIVTTLIPLLALMLGYAAVVGEKEQGSIQLLLSMPVTRREVLLGKFLGLGSVLVIAILAGLGLAGAIVVVSAGAADLLGYVLFVLGTILFALAFLSVALLLSTLMKKRSSSLAMAVFLWIFFAMIFSLVLLGLYVATGGVFDPLSGRTPVYPDWYHVLRLVSPPEAFSLFAGYVFGGAGLPSMISAPVAALSLGLWTAGPFGLALWAFRRRDL